MPNNIPANFIKKSLDLITKRQTNILAAAYVIMATVVLSQLLGIIRYRILVSIFGPSNLLGSYYYASDLPDTIFQLTIASALSSAFIPVFSDYLARGKEQEGHKMASTLLCLGIGVFFILSVILFIFAPFFLQIFNLGNNFSQANMDTMANMMRIIIFGQLIFTVAMFYTALLQSYNHFFLPGLSAALYNLGIIVGVLVLSPFIGIYSAPVGVVLGALIFLLAQLPLLKKIHFTFSPSLAYIKSEGVIKVGKLMWPRTISIIIFQLGTLAISAYISYLSDPGRMKLLFEYAKTLAFAPVALFGQTIAQAAFPVLSRMKNNPDSFKSTFITTFNQMLYLILPISALILILRIPIVRLIYGADSMDWPATLLTGKLVAILSLSIFAQALVTLILRGFYALHNTKIPLIVGAIATFIMILLVNVSVTIYHFGIESIALSYTIGAIIQFIILLILLDRKVGGFNKVREIVPLLKFLISTFFTAIALYIPIKLLDKLVIDTTHTIGLIIITGISTLAGLFLYLFLTWFFDVKEAKTYILAIQKFGNWKEVTMKIQEVFAGNRVNP